MKKNEVAIESQNNEIELVELSQLNRSRKGYRNSTIGNKLYEPFV